jgi:hypothetical protein
VLNLFGRCAGADGARTADVPVDVDGFCDGGTDGSGGVGACAQQTCTNATHSMHAQITLIPCDTSAHLIRFYDTAYNRHQLMAAFD